MENLKVTGWNIRKCSVRLSRCDFTSRRSAARPEGGVPAAPHALTPPAASYDAGHVQEYATALAMIIKMEDDDKDAFTTQESDSVLACLSKDTVTDIGWRIKEESDFVVKMEDEAHGMMVKQELDIGPTVLRAPPAPRAQVDPDPRPSTTSGGDAAPAPPCNYLEDEMQKMEVTGWNIRECSVRVSRCDFSSLRSAARLGGGVPAAPHALMPPAACAAGQVQVALDPRPSTSSDGGVAPAPLCESFFSSVPKIESQDNHNEEGSKKRAEYDCQRALSERFDDCTGGEDTAEDRREGGQQYQCHYCKYNTTRRSYLVKHVRRHMVEKLYKCKQCEYSASNLSHLEIHMRTHTGEKPFSCNQCQYRASQNNSLKRHMRTHTSEKPYVCKQCKYRASELSHLKIHMRTHTGEKPYACKQCKYSASRLGNLKRHMRTHTGEKPYNCAQCEYSTSEQHNIKIHMRTHTGEKPYACRQCKYSTSRLDYLKIHMRTHTGEKPYACKQCEYSTSQIGSLKIHMRTHTGEKPYTCMQCKYSASHLGSLKIHMRTHTGEKPNE